MDIYINIDNVATEDLPLTVTIDGALAADLVLGGNSSRTVDLGPDEDGFYTLEAKGGDPR